MLSIWGNVALGKSFRIRLFDKTTFAEGKDVLVFAETYDDAVELARREGEALGLEPRTLRQLN